MNLQFLGHACFLLDDGAHKALVDPYLTGNPLAAVSADQVETDMIFVTHGHYYGVSMDITGVIDEAKDRGCNAVFFGHTHKPLLETIDGVLALNPGSLTYPRQRGRRPSYAIVNLDQTGHLTAELKYL